MSSERMQQIFYGVVAMWGMACLLAGVMRGIYDAWKDKDKSSTGIAVAFLSGFYLAGGVGVFIGTLLLIFAYCASFVIVAVFGS